MIINNSETFKENAIWSKFTNQFSFSRKHIKPINKTDMIILKIFFLILLSNSKSLFLFNIKNNNKALTHALIEVANAIPISLIVCIKIKDKIILIKTLIIEMYKGVFVSSLAKKHVTKTFIKIYAGNPTEKIESV